MEETKTEFIPKKPLAEERVEHVARKRPVSIVSFLATIIFFASLIGAGGVYFYKVTLTKRVTEMGKQLELARGAFEPTLITDMQDLDKRINAARQILSSHITISPIFEALEDLTLKTIRFTDFTYSMSDGGQITIEMSGKAIDYKSIAIQSDLFDGNKHIKNQIFSNLTLDERGNVSFDLTFTVDPALVLYGRSV